MNTEKEGSSAVCIQSLKVFDSEIPVLGADLKVGPPEGLTGQSLV